MRKDSRDRSRRLLAFGSLMSGLLAALALMGNVSAGESNTAVPMLHPYIGYIYLTMHIIMTLYPISVVRPDWLTTRRSFFLFLPTAVFAIAFICFTGHWTPLYTFEQLVENIAKPDVIVRLASLLIMLPYCLILFFLPYNYRQSSASFRWILNYSFGLLVLCIVHITLMLTYYTPLMIALPILATVFYAFSTEYELEDRLLPANLPEPVAEPVSAVEPAAAIETAASVEPANEAGLWSRVCQIMDTEEAWRDPDLSLIELTHRCATNVTYLNRIIREETGGGFKEMLNRKRIGSVVAQLQENPKTDIQDAFFNAGYRSRITAWRNFKDIVGVTPTEFRANNTQ
ncbi:MAG: AraC family transcriptional regulator [Bacteroidales bacterium]|nr:AraC family transcriptional regulator [Bacteroidales bacterium]